MKIALAGRHSTVLNTAETVTNRASSRYHSGAWYKSDWKAIRGILWNHTLNHQGQSFWPGCNRRPSSRLTGASFFNTYYDGVCAPLYIFCGKHLLCASPTNVDQQRTIDELRRVIQQIRSRWSFVNILVRGDSLFTRRNHELVANLKLGLIMCSG